MTAPPEGSPETPETPETTVDILLASYNGARFLPELLASLAAQTHAAWRLIARDDGSTDGTRALLADWAAARPGQVVLIEPQGRPLGASGSFGALLAASEAPYFLFCDQDDVWLPDKIARLLALAQAAEREAGPETAGPETAGPETVGTDTPVLVHSDLRVVAADLAELAPSYWHRQNFHPDRAARTGALLLQNCVTGCALLGNAALRRAACPVPEVAIMHDWWCAAVAWRAGRLVTCPTPTVLYRQHGANALGSPGAMTALRAAWVSLTDPGQIRGFARSLDDRARQAAVLLDRFPGDPDSPATRFCAEFARLRELPFLARKRFLARHGVRTGHRVFDLAFSVLA